MYVKQDMRLWAELTFEAKVCLSNSYEFSVYCKGNTTLYHYKD
jgi:hypothetical protein